MSSQVFWDTYTVSTDKYTKLRIQMFTRNTPEGLNFQDKHS